MKKDPNSISLRRCALTLMLSAFPTFPAFAQDASNSASAESSATGSAPSAFSAQFGDLLRPGTVAPSTTNESDSLPPLAKPISDGAATPAELHSTKDRAPQYGKPFADSLDQSATPAARVPGDGATADSSPGGAEPQTVAPFHTVGGGLAALSSIQRPRPINIPADASPALKAAIAAIPNMSVVSPVLWRGSQPTSSDLALLKQAGVHTIVNLRNEEILVNREANDAKRLGLNFVSIPMALFDNPSKTQFTRFLSAVDSSAPVFVHCQKGEDRTGTMVAVYRMSRENWDANKAYQEMVAMGFKPMLGSLSGAVFDYSASLGRPARRPPPSFSGLGGLGGMTSILMKH